MVAKQERLMRHRQSCNSNEHIEKARICNWTLKLPWRFTVNLWQSPHQSATGFLVVSQMTIGKMANVDILSINPWPFPQNLVDWYSVANSSLRSNSHLKCSLGKGFVLFAVVCAFHATGLVPCRAREESCIHLDQGQTKPVRHRHDYPHMEGRFRWEEKREIHLKWKQD
jgi:hypothetical protein